MILQVSNKDEVSAPPLKANIQTQQVKKQTQKLPLTVDSAHPRVNYNWFSGIEAQTLTISCHALYKD